VFEATRQTRTFAYDGLDTDACYMAEEVGFEPINSNFFFCFDQQMCWSENDNLGKVFLKPLGE